jgi:hypothetical protein
MIVVMIRIGLILERRRRLLSLRYPRLSATGSGKRTAVEVALARHKDSFMADDDVGVRIPNRSPDKSIMTSRRHATAKRSRARCFKRQGNAWRNTLTERTVLAGKDKLAALLSDQRGAFAFEVPILWLFLAMSLLLPLADVAAAGFQYTSAWGALRNFGQSIQYDPPTDFANASGWTSSKLAKADSRFPIQNFQLVCGSSACSGTNTASPRYYSYTTTVTISPMVLRSVLCTSGCSFTLPYSERFS